MINISEVLDDPLFIQPIEFGIISNKTNSNGDVVETEVRSTHANTNVQPASAAVLQLLPEGERTKEIYQVFTKAYFPLKNGDYMYYLGNKYRCYMIEKWEQYGYSDGIFIKYSGAQEIIGDGFQPFD